MTMGRKGKPGKIPHFEQKGNSFYHVPAVGKRKWTPLGSDRAAALVRWAEIEGRTDNGTFADLFRWFMTTAKLADSTRKNYEIQGAKVLRVFGNFPPAAIKSPMLADYRDKCPPGAANVRLGIVKTVFAAAAEKGKCETNPARDVKRLPMVRRDRYITDVEFVAVRDKADDFLRVAMNIAYQIGCRPSDVIKMRLSDVTDEGVLLIAKKTGKKTLYSMAPDLQSALNEAKALERGVKSLYVLCDYRGQPYKTSQLASAWKRACKAAEVLGTQFRDVRAKTASDDEDGAQKRLQHTSKETTRGYIRKVPVVTPISRKL